MTSVDVNRIHDGWGLLHIAATNNNAKMIKSLVASETRIDQRNVNGDTALLLSIYMGYMESTRMLANYHENLNMRGQ